jgi:hypothetical protein
VSGIKQRFPPESVLTKDKPHQCGDRPEKQTVKEGGTFFMKIRNLLLGVVAFVILAGSVAPAQAQGRHHGRHPRHHHRHHRRG